MFKTLTSFIIFLFFMHSAFAANASTSRDLKRTQVDKISKIVSDYLNSMASLSATFTQEDSNGVVRKGRLVIKKPNNVRIDYFTPEEESLVIDDEFIALFNKTLNELNYISSEGMPIHFLSKENIDLKRDLNVNNVYEQKNLISIEGVVENKKYGNHIIVMRFSNKPVHLSVIRVVSLDGSYVELKVDDINYDDVPLSTFEIRRPDMNSRN